MAVIPAIIIVAIPINIKIFDKFMLIIIMFIRINKYTPAVTNVEEWTKAETGVGAAIAAGSHAEKGTWALLVIAEITIKYLSKSDKLFVIKLLYTYVHEPTYINIEILINSPTSPNRLVIAVSIPALYDLLLW